MTTIEKQNTAQQHTVVTDSQSSVLVMIEIPKGSRNKYEYNYKRNAIQYDRMIHSSVQYPSDYGFILDTLAEDGDALDALVLLWEPTFPGCIIEVKPVGMLEMWDDKGLDQKIICVPLHDPFHNHINNLSGMPQHLLKEIKHFFSIYKTLENKYTKVEGWKDRPEAIKAIEKSRKAFISTKHP